jgi:hypothetical protein
MLQAICLLYVFSFSKFSWPIFLAFLNSLEKLFATEGAKFQQKSGSKPHERQSVNPFLSFVQSPFRFFFTSSSQPSLLVIPFTSSLFSHTSMLQ